MLFYVLYITTPITVMPLTMAVMWLCGWRPNDQGAGDE